MCFAPADCIQYFVAAELKTFRPKNSNVQKVLLVDDDPLQLRIRETVLRKAGVEVCIATNALSALAFLRAEAHSFGAIVTDHFMPEIAGSEFVRRLRKLDSSIPVIVVSGADAEDEYEGLNVIFRQKPCHPLELISLVQHSFDKAA